MLRAFPMSLTGAAIRWLRNKPTGSITTWEDPKTKFLSKYCLAARTTKKIKEINNFQQEPDENLYQAWERFKELLMKCAIPSKTAADAKTAIQEMTEYSQKWHNETSRVRNMPEDIKVPLILERPFLSTARAKIDVYKRKITLKVGEERIVFTSVKHASSLIKRVYMLSLRERMKLDLEARLMGETLVLNRSLDPFLEDYIKLNDLNETFELRRNQGDDLIPTIKEGEVIEEFRTRDDELDAGIDDYPSYCDYDKKIHIDCAHNLKFSCMIGFEFTHTNFFPLFYVNVRSKKFHNSIMKDKMVYKGNNVIGALKNVPIFVRNFSVMTDFAVLENMDDYRDEGIGGVIFGEPFLREVRIKTRWSEGMITIYNMMK
ncbi:homeodomain-like protein [Tanacetum coccineum]